MKAREGDLIETKDNVVFDVKGLIHPSDRIIAFPRYIPSDEGTRKSNDSKYNKIYNLAERFKYLKKNSPELIVFDPVFGETLCEVPITQIAKIYRPQDKLSSLRNARTLNVLEKKALQLAKTLKSEANIPWSSIGISGSIMTGLTTEKSDIDPIVYGLENSHKAYAALKRLLEKTETGFKPYTRSELKELFDFRSKDTQMSFEDFQTVESHKAFQGKFIGVDFFVRFIKESSEITEHYGDIHYKNEGYVKLQAKITDTTDSLFTPCNYKINDVKVLEGPELEPIAEIVSFRGRFCEQAKNNEKIEAQGKIELVANKKTGSEHYRIILGNKPSDYMVLIS